ncbi:plasmid stabilization system protein [Variibacter gotjawalensis]|uniref:Plasmid stabilization system protein n=1 Tax=Variibacter gotjawalensis TaxID=1333996 RepID=A0A0S3PQ95_9BRAD|nr:type II toxin-antitoxin system RelE/ParE family toxin [Variibacter gotjawalensis]RZS50267.1 toxin ParE1/3/4 [Variibacter gotjawalensis]BAT58100.1 plasmid stabilization system protein [Variibacter gotjawalensis]
MGNYRLSIRAQNDLSEIWESISPHNLSAANALLVRIRDRLLLAADNPLMFAARPEIGPKARIFAEGPYLIIYEPIDDGILVVAIVHGKRDPDRWVRN